MKKHLALTGFMGCGKTTYGRKLSQISKIPFIDLDEYIEQQEQKTIIEIFEKDGEEKFREIETYYLKQILEIPDKRIIALGGGTICYNNNLELVLAHTWLFTIMVKPEVLAERLWAEKEKRPLIKNIRTKEELKLFVQNKLDERMPFYKKADWVVEL